MYQSVDDLSGAPERPRGQPSTAAVIGLGLFMGAAAFGLVYLSLPGVIDFGPSEHDQDSSLPEARAAYLRALSEPNAALRRARLTDFIDQHSEDRIVPAAKAQLDVLERAEARDWQDVISIAMDPISLTSDAETALRGFERRWGGYLGGRDADIEQLKVTLADRDLQPAPPDRSLPGQGSNFSAGVPGDQLAGGQQGAISPPVIEVPPSRPQPELDTEPQSAPSVIKPRVRSHVEPRYPRSALRRGIGAKIVLSLSIDAEGRVQDAELVSADARRYEKSFIRAATRAAKRTRYYPQTVDGQAVAVTDFEQSYRFQPE